MIVEKRPKYFLSLMNVCLYSVSINCLTVAHLPTGNVEPNPSTSPANNHRPVTLINADPITNYPLDSRLDSK